MADLLSMDTKLFKNRTDSILTLSQSVKTFVAKSLNYNVGHYDVVIMEFKWCSGKHL